MYYNYEECSKLLRTQHRANAHLIDFVNQEVYRGVLESHEDVRYQTVRQHGILSNPLMIVSTEGSSWERKNGLSSWYNRRECDIVCLIVQCLTRNHRISPDKISVITMYRAQKDLLREFLYEDATT